jgi:hypothetical protein
MFVRLTLRGAHAQTKHALSLTTPSKVYYAFCASRAGHRARRKGCSAMAQFKSRDRVQQIGHWAVRTVEEIREGPGTEALYSIQLGTDFASRIWVKESELEAAEPEPYKVRGGKIGKSESQRLERQTATNAPAPCLEKGPQAKRQGRRQTYWPQVKGRLPAVVFTYAPKNLLKHPKADHG